MASTISDAEPAAVTLAAFARELAARRAAIGPFEMPRNAGTNRTDSKRALLAAIAAAGGRW